MARADADALRCPGLEEPVLFGNTDNMKVID